MYSLCRLQYVGVSLIVKVGLILVSIWNRHSLSPKLISLITFDPFLSIFVIFFVTSLKMLRWEWLSILGLVLAFGPCDLWLGEIIVPPYSLAVGRRLAAGSFVWSVSKLQVTITSVVCVKCQQISCKLQVMITPMVCVECQQISCKLQKGILQFLTRLLIQMSTMLLEDEYRLLFTYLTQQDGNSADDTKSF